MTPTALEGDGKPEPHSPAPPWPAWPNDGWGEWGGEQPRDFPTVLGATLTATQTQAATAAPAAQAGDRDQGPPERPRPERPSGSGGGGQTPWDRPQGQDGGGARRAVRLAHRVAVATVGVNPHRRVMSRMTRRRP